MTNISYKTTDMTTKTSQKSTACAKISQKSKRITKCSEPDMLFKVTNVKNMGAQAQTDNKEPLKFLTHEQRIQMIYDH
jgi:hypothetical protein